MLSASLLGDIQSKIDEGDTYLNSDAFPQALERYRTAVSMIPDPKWLHDISLAAFTAVGEACYYSGNYTDAVRAFQEAMKAPGGVENPLLQLRLGQAYYDSSDWEHAGESLTKAYALGGPEVFDGEDDKYLSFLASRIDL